MKEFEVPETINPDEEVDEQDENELNKAEKGFDMSMAFYADEVNSANFSLKNRDIIYFGIEKILREAGNDEADAKMEKMDRAIYMIMNCRNMVRDYEPDMDWSLEEVVAEIEKYKNILEAVLEIKLESEDELAPRKNIQ